MANRKTMPALIFALLVHVNSAYAQCETDTMDAQALGRLGDLSITLKEELQYWEPALIEFDYASTKLEATNYNCSKSEMTTYSTYRGYAWIVRMPIDAWGQVTDIDQSVSRVISQNESRYLRSGLYNQTIIDIDSEQQINADDSLDVILRYPNLFPELESIKVYISGSFWKLEEQGTVPIGIVQTEAGTLLQPYVSSFSARHTLCLVNGGGVELFTREMTLRKAGSQDALITTVNNQTASRCQGAIQVGPTFIEPQTSGKSRYGISGLSRRPGKRNVIFKTIENDESGTLGSLFLLSTISSISSFDTMVLISGLSEKIILSRHSGTTNRLGALDWAVGLQDDRYASGPIVQNGDKIYRLTETDVPTGTVLTFK